MRILFCNIAWMDYYKGIISGKDEPTFGGAYVRKTGDAVEKYNFKPVEIPAQTGLLPEGRYCLGYVSTRETRGKANQLHIERIEGCGVCAKEPAVYDVLVVFCAKHPGHGFTTVVGWYRNAVVFRDIRKLICGTEKREFYFAAKSEDCVLLPRQTRGMRSEWFVPRKNRSGAAFGFGQSNVWFADEKDAIPAQKTSIDKLLARIIAYNGENWLEKNPE